MQFLAIFVPFLLQKKLTLQLCIHLDPITLIKFSDTHVAMVSCIKTLALHSCRNGRILHLNISTTPYSILYSCVQLVADAVAAELAVEQNVSSVEKVVNTDDENEEEEYEAWKVRELQRIKRDREEREQ